MANFEQRKNIKALGITLVICGCMLVMLLLISWQVPKVLPPKNSEGIEVNLGTSEEGIGETPVMAVGEPSSSNNEAQQIPTDESIAKNIDETNDTKDDNGEPINTDTKVSTNKPVVKTNKEQPLAKNIVVKPVEAPKPKALFKGGNNSDNKGGNNQDSYNGVTNQGIASGKGDQGKINGNINSDSYSGDGGNGGGGAVRIKSGLTGRKFTKYPSFEDDFNENAKVAVDIRVNAEGKIISAIVNPKGTTTTSLSIRNIAIKKAFLLKMNSSDTDEQVGTIVFEFKLKG